VRGPAILNAAGLALVLGASMASIWTGRPTASARSEAPPPASASPDAPIVDHGGFVLPRGDYRRIIAANTVAAALLLELGEPDRLLAVSEDTRNGFRGYRYAGKATIAHTTDFEAILAMHPDLVLVNVIGDPRPMQRMRDAGVVVFDLGEMRGLSTLIPNIHQIAAILGHPERGDAFARSVLEQMATVDVSLAKSGRPRAMYLSVYGDSVFGGARGTSYDDVLTAAGLVDAAGDYRDWPRYTIEQVLALDPDVIVTNAGMRPRICEHPALSLLRACGGTDRVVEVDGALLEDPGPAMVEAARTIHAAVFGPAATASTPQK
jgi:iron complex transport system substrate-binding protein